MMDSKPRRKVQNVSLTGTQGVHSRVGSSGLFKAAGLEYGPVKLSISRYVTRKTFISLAQKP